MITKLKTKSDKMLENFLDSNFKSYLLNHFESTINEIDIQTESDILNKNYLEDQLKQTREILIQHVNSCKINNFNLYGTNQTRFVKETNFCFCFFLKNDHSSIITKLIGVLVEIDFYLSSTQTDFIK